MPIACIGDSIPGSWPCGLGILTHVGTQHPLGSAGYSVRHSGRWVPDPRGRHSPMPARATPLLQETEEAPTSWPPQTLVASQAPCLGQVPSLSQQPPGPRLQSGSPNSMRRGPPPHPCKQWSRADLFSAGAEQVLAHKPNGKMHIRPQGGITCPYKKARMKPTPSNTALPRPGARSCPHCKGECVMGQAPRTWPDRPLSSQSQSCHKTCGPREKHKGPEIARDLGSGSAHTLL